MKIQYKSWNPKPESEMLVDVANSIIDEYNASGYTLTLRQLYYQFVARDIIENSERSYKNLGGLITKARMAGLVSWEAIEDRNREYNDFWYRENPADAIRLLPRYIRFDQWARQETYVEVWVEKEALGNVISRACDKWLVPHMACKGYLSASEAWRAGQRFEEKLNEGKNCVLIHLGDHDPSGIDMTRDNKDRVELFSGFGDVDVRRIALNRDQIDEFQPPPNPTKVTDSRAASYIKEHGHTCWELDALEPAVMEKMITNEFKQFIDFEKWNDVIDDESDVELQLERLHDNWDEIEGFLNEID